MFYPTEHAVQEPLSNLDFKRRSNHLEVISNLIWQGYEHERMAWPDMEVVRVQQKRRLAIGFAHRARRHPEFQVFVGNVGLLIIHAVYSQGTASER